MIWVLGVSLVLSERLHFGVMESMKSAKPSKGHVQFYDLQDTIQYLSTVVLPAALSCSLQSSVVSIFRFLLEILGSFGLVGVHICILIVPREFWSFPGCIGFRVRLFPFPLLQFSRSSIDGERLQGMSNG